MTDLDVCSPEPSICAKSCYRESRFNRIQQMPDELLCASGASSFGPRRVALCP
jgi:hypothetical protein